MRHSLSRLLLSSVLTTLVLCQAAAAELAPTPITSVPRRIPASEFAQRPTFTQPVISPDGQRILGRIEIRGKVMLGIHSLAKGMLPPISLPEKADLNWYRWAGNNRILISIARTVPYFDEEARATWLVSYDLENSKGTFVGKKSQGLEGDDLLYVDPEGKWILLSIQKTIYDYPSVFRADLATGDLREVVKQRSDVWEWYADETGVVRAGIGFGDHSWSMVYRRTGDDSFQRLGKAKYDDETAQFDLLRFATEHDEGYVLSNKVTGRYALYKFNYATKTLGALILESPTNDITDFSLTADGKDLYAAWYTDDRDRIRWFDPNMQKLQEELDKAVPDRESWIVSRDRNNQVLLVWVGASHDPGQLYVFRPDTGIMRRIYVYNDKLKPSELAHTSYVRYKARDGLEIPAYLTLPKGRESKNLPLIILPHGGPYGVRDNGDYNPEVQLLANRGYAVLQPNYRGSDGYGIRFYEKGESQWGRHMQDDLDDGMDWLVGEKIVDPKRVCIVGSSYGGYAALWGATRNPERYRCAASFAGISDLGKQLKYQISFMTSKKYRKDWRRTVQGGINFDTKTVSPLYTLDRLHIPVLVAHGDADQTVPFKQSDLYAKALKNSSKEYEYHIYKDEGHGFSTSSNLQHWLEHLEAFLTKHNPA